jgi:hypothetical protein
VAGSHGCAGLGLPFTLVPTHKRRRPKKELPWELNPYRDPTEAETSDEENTDEEEEDEEREGRGREPGRGMLDAEEDYAEPLQHDFFDPVEDRAVRTHAPSHKSVTTLY